MRRYVVLAALTLVVVGSFGGYALSSAGSAPRTAARSGCSGWFPATPLAAQGPRGQRSRACFEAARLLPRVTLPASATPSPSEPAGDRGALRRPAITMAGMRLVDLHRFWTVSEPERAVYAFLVGHTPATAKQGYGMLSQPGPSGVLESSMSYVFPPGAGYVPLRQLEVTVAALQDGGSGVRVDAQAQEIVSRPKGERIPVRVGVLDFTIGVSGKPPRVSRTVTSRALMHRIAAMIDRLQTVQPEAISCPSYPLHPSMVTFTFRATPHGRVLARASEMAGAIEPTTPCDPMTLEIEGRQWKPLLGGAAVVHRVQRMLRLKPTG